MKICEIISVGTELLLGDVTDSNASYLSQKMKELGFCVYFRQTCGDNEERIRASLSLALSRSDLVLITGGLGPTYDDLTREACASYFHLPLEPDRSVMEKISAFFQRRGIEMAKNNLRQAMIPQGALVLDNDWGTAPGIRIDKDGKTVILLPGVPREMKAIFEYRVLPQLSLESEFRLKTKVLKLYGISESRVDELLSSWMRNGTNPTLAPYAGNGEVELHVTASANTPDEAEKKCAEMEREILPLIGKYCYGEGDETLEEVLVKRFSQDFLTVATAESCTGGMLSQRITAVPGASSVLKLGVCAYTEEAKKRVLGVSDQILKDDGVYSEACALEMARGVRALSGADYAAAVTGIAGPVGATEKDPVGCVYLAVVGENRERVGRFVFGHSHSSREQIRQLASSKALAMLLEEAGRFCR